MCSIRDELESSKEVSDKLKVYIKHEEYKHNEFREALKVIPGCPSLTHKCLCTDDVNIRCKSEECLDIIIEKSKSYFNNPVELEEDDYFGLPY